MDAYTNNFKFIGSRTNVTSGGTYIITGPNWNGKIPSGMTEIKSPTNTMWLLLRILVNGPQDVNTVRGLQDGFDLSPLIHQTANNNTTASANQSSSSVPVSPMPTAIPTTGVKIFDEIGNDMISNPRATSFCALSSAA